MAPPNHSEVLEKVEHLKRDALARLEQALVTWALEALFEHPGCEQCAPFCLN